MNKSNPLTNFFSIVFGRTGELIITFFAITLLIRYLGTSQYGVFSSVIALLGIFSKIIDLGFSQILFREYSAKTEKRHIINSAITIRIVLFIVLVLFYNIFAIISSINGEEIIITNILFTNIIISSKFRNIRDLLEIPFKSKLRMDIVMFTTFIDSIFLLLFVILGSYFRFSLIEITIVYTIANLPGFLILIYFLSRTDLIIFKITFNKIHWLFKESIHLWGAGFLTIIFTQFDVVLLKNFRSPEDAGLFSAALRVGVPLSILPLSLITTVFPIIVKNRISNIQISQKIIVFSYKTLSFLIIFLAIFITFHAKKILILLYGKEFEQADISLVLIFWSFLFFYLNQLTQNLLTIISKQKFNFYYSVVLVFIYIIILLITLIDYGPVGAGLARLISSFTGFVFLTVVILKTELRTEFITLSNILFLISLVVIGYFLNLIGDIWFYIFFPISTFLLLYIYQFYDYQDLNLFIKLLNEPKWLTKFQKK